MRLDAAASAIRAALLVVVLFSSGAILLTPYDDWSGIDDADAFRSAIDELVAVGRIGIIDERGMLERVRVPPPDPTVRLCSEFEPPDDALDAATAPAGEEASAGRSIPLSARLEVSSCLRLLRVDNAARIVAGTIHPDDTGIGHPVNWARFDPDMRIGDLLARAPRPGSHESRQVTLTVPADGIGAWGWIFDEIRRHEGDGPTMPWILERLPFIDCRPDAEHCQVRIPARAEWTDAEPAVIEGEVPAQTIVGELHWRPEETFLFEDGLPRFRLVQELVPDDLTRREAITRLRTLAERAEEGPAVLGISIRKSLLPYLTPPALMLASLYLLTLLRQLGRLRPSVPELETMFLAPLLPGRGGTLAAVLIAVLPIVSQGFLLFGAYLRATRLPSAVGSLPTPAAIAWAGLAASMLIGFALVAASRRIVRSAETADTPTPPVPPESPRARPSSSRGIHACREAWPRSANCGAPSDKATEPD